MGTKFNQDYITFVEEQVDVIDNDLTNIERADLENILQAAVDRYSQDAPQVLVSQVTGDGSHRYALPTGWDASFSHIIGIELPAAQQSPIFLRRKSFKISNIGDGNGDRIHFTDRTPTSSDTFAVHYTTLHELGDASSTVDDADWRALAYLFCHHTCVALAGRLRRTTDSRLQADIIDPRRTKADEYLTQARAFFELYRGLMGLPDKGPRPADIVGDVDLGSTWGGNVGYLTHQGSR